MARANRIRLRLRAKLGEIMSSGLEQNVRMALSRSVQIQLDRVEMKILQIRRRERAQQEEKRERRVQERQKEERRVEQQREEARRRRRSDMRQRSIRIRRDFLYPSNKGGFDPYKMSPNLSGGSSGTAVSFSVAGQSGVVMDSAVPSGDVVNVVV